MACTKGIPVALHLNSKTFADPAHAGSIAIETLESAIAALAEEADPTQIIRIGTAATYVDRLGDCREAFGGSFATHVKAARSRRGSSPCSSSPSTISRRAAGMKPST